jgi:hypothetical protein
VAPAGRRDGSCAVGSSICAALRLVKKRLPVGQLGSSKRRGSVGRHWDLGQKELKGEQEQRENERRWINGGIAQPRSHLLKERLISFAVQVNDADLNGKFRSLSRRTKAN